MAAESKKPAVVLLSGGLDSTTTLAIARSEGFEPYALTVEYGQRHKKELEAAARVAKTFGVVAHSLVQFDLRQWGGSALTGTLEVPKDRSAEEMGRGVPVTYVPARNTIFLSFALSWAEVLGATDIYIGVNALDYSGYPDCRPEFIESFEKLANLATKAGAEEYRKFHIHAPLILSTKGEIIRWGLDLGVDYSLTWSCYDPAPDGKACGACDSCLLRLKGFSEAEISDPIAYASR